MWRYLKMSMLWLWIVAAALAPSVAGQVQETVDGPAGDHQESQPAVDLQAIRLDFEAGRLAAAQSAVEAALSREDASPELHLLAARVFGARAREMASTMTSGGTFARMLRLDALAELGKARDGGLERTADVDLLQAGLLREEGRLDEAARVAEAGLADGPRPDLLLELARIRQDQGRDEEAVPLARRCLELDPHDVDAGILEIGALERLGRREEALEAIGSLARANPERLEIAGLLWPLHGGVADFKTAVAHYEALAEALPGEAWYRFYLGATRRRAGDLDGAERDLRRAFAMRPELLEITAELGWVAAQQGRLDAAAGELIKVVADEGPLREKALPTLQSVAAGLAQQFDFSRSLECYEAVLAADPTNYYARLDRALVLRQMGRTEDSLRAYAEAQELYPGDGNVLNDHALVYLGTGREAEARELFAKAAAVGSVDGDENLAMLAWYEGALATCREHLQAVLERESDRVKSRYYLEMVRRREAAEAADR